MASLSNCKMCSLSNSKEHISFSKGKKPANVLIVFNREPKSQQHNLFLLAFIRQLKTLVEHDFYYTYAIKCFQEKEKINLHHIKGCRKWLKKEIDVVEPYLIILMGSIAKIAVLGGKFHNLLQPNVFYKQGLKEREKIFFIGESITGNPAKIKTNLSKLLIFIKARYYG